MPHVIALDQGTTSCRAIVFDDSGAACAVAQREFEQLYPRPGWVEHDPLSIWTTQIGVAEDAVRQAGLSAQDIRAIGITNQRETTVLWDRRSGEPLGPAIVWQDRRTAAHCERLKSDGLTELFQQKTGLVIDAYFSATKLAWMLEHLPGARALAEAGAAAFGTIDSWLIWKLSGGGVHVTDASNASRTLLYDIYRGAWDDELLRIFNIPPLVLPEVRPSSEVYGAVRLPGSALDGVPIAGCAGDQQAALFGQACTQPGLAKSTYGTGCFLLVNTGTEAVTSRHNLLTTVAWQIGERTEYALEGSVFIGGAVVQWLRDEMGFIDCAADSESLAASVPDSGGVQFVPAFAGLGAPHWDPHARGAILGLTRGTTRAHIVRAALEAVCHQVADVLDCMTADADGTIAQLRVDGGAVVNDLLMQYQSDILGVPLARPAITETTALGAAYLAGLAVGLWTDTDDIAAHWRMERLFEPQMSQDRRAAARQGWQQAVQRAKRWARGTVQ